MLLHETTQARMKLWDPSWYILSMFNKITSSSIRSLHNELEFPCGSLLHPSVKRIWWACDAFYNEDRSVRSRCLVPLHKRRLLRCCLACTLTRFCDSGRDVIHPRLLVRNSQQWFPVRFGQRLNCLDDCMLRHDSRGFVASAAVRFFAIRWHCLPSV